MAVNHAVKGVAYSELKTHEKTLRESEARFNAAFMYSPVAMSIHQLKTSSIVEVNIHLLRISGYSREELLGKKLWDFQIWADKMIRPVLLRKLRETRYFRDFETQIRSKSGEIRTVNSSAEIIEFNNEEYVICSFEDITERKKTQEKILELATIVEYSSDAIVSGTLSGVITYWNKAAEKMFGYKADEIMGKSINLLRPQEKIKEKSSEVVSKITKGDAVDNFESVRVKKNGELIDVLISISPLVDSNNKVKGFSANFRDISEKKKVQQEMFRLDRLDIVAQMAAGIGHEIRNPMTTVRGFLQMLGSTENNDLKKEYYQLMISELDRANLIITEYLSLAGHRKIETEERNLNEVLDTLFPLMHAEAMQQNKDIQLEKGTIPHVLINESEIRQMVLNLVRNGLEAMEPRGTVFMETYLKCGEVILSVRDGGKGIAPEIKGKVGTPFVTNKDNGTGLGLAVCFSIAKRHNAKIDFTTGIQGTTFKVKFKPLV